jgi:hypothetical protein
MVWDGGSFVCGTGFRHRGRAVLAGMGCPLPEEVEVRVWDSFAEVRYLVLPQRPPRPGLSWPPWFPGTR